MSTEGRLFVIKASYDLTSAYTMMESRNFVTSSPVVHSSGFLWNTVAKRKAAGSLHLQWEMVILSKNC